MASKKWRARTRQELIIEVWEALDCESVGEHELQAIQAELRAHLGDEAVISPSAIARAVADEGAVLRHPEVMHSDTAWREQQLRMFRVEHEFDFSSITAAASSLATIEKLHVAAAKEGDQAKLNRLRDLIVYHRQEVQLVARSKVVTDYQRSVAKEVAHWLSVWLEQPSLFLDWLSLRQRSPEYLRKFK